MAVNPEIKKLTEKIRHTGPADQVRESIAGGMDLTSEEASATRKLADQTENRQTKVESDFKTLQQEYTENGNGAQTTAEISLARDGEPVLADRLNRDFGNITAQFQQTMTQTEFDSWVATLLDGGPSIFIDSLSALISAYPNGSSGVALVRETDPAKIYVWNGTNWENYGNYQGIELKNGTVTPKKTTFIELSSNIIDRENLILNKTIDYVDGKVVENESNDITDFIEIESLKEYVFKYISRVVFYRMDRTFISTNSYSNDRPSTHSISAPKEAYFARFVIYKTERNLAQANEGSVLLPYEYSKTKLSKKISVPASSIEGLIVKPEETTFIVPGSNLFNKKTVVKNKVISTNGTIADNESYVYSDFISVDHVEYILAAAHSIAFYNESKTFLSRITIPLEEKYEYKFTPNLEVEYIVINVNTVADDIGQTQLNKGLKLLEYEPFGLRFSDDIIVGKQNSNSGIEYDDAYYIDGDLDGVYSAPTLPAKPSMNDMEVAEIHGLYDSLVAEYPEYITKTLLGKDESGTYDVNRYDFKFSDVEPFDQTVKTPKIILVGGVHYEKASVHILYTALKEICENWKNDPTLEVLRWNVHFIVIPIANPWGFDNGKSRNVNDVNIARNFPPEWSDNTGNGSFAGNYPLSEAESRFIDQVLSENKDAILFSSFHNFFIPATDNVFIRNFSATKMQVHLNKLIVQKLSRKWKKEYDWLPQDETTMLGYAGMDSPKASEGRQAAFYGIQGGTFEFCQEFFMEPDHVPFSSVALTLGLETFINWLVLNLKHNTDYYNSKG